MGSGRDFPDSGPVVGGGLLLSDANVLACGWLGGAVVVTVAVVSSSTVTAVVVGWKVVDLDVAAAVVAGMADEAAVDHWVDLACLLVVQASVVEGWEGRTDAGKMHKENLGLGFSKGYSPDSNI